MHRRECPTAVELLGGQVLCLRAGSRAHRVRSNVSEVNRAWVEQDRPAVCDAHSIKIRPGDCKPSSLSRAQLLDGVWGDSSEIDERTVDVIVRRLRRQLEPFGCRDYIQTVRSIGYRFSALIN